MNARTNPVAFTFTETPGSGERYAVHLNGDIARPAIGMAPSGRWQFAGLADGRGRMVTPLAAVLDALAAGERPAGKYVRDVDCGTTRVHGAALADIRLAADLPADWRDLAEGHRVARVEFERDKADRAAADRLAVARKARMAVATVEGVEVRRAGESFYVIDGDAATDALSFAGAAQALGAALIERHS